MTGQTKRKADAIVASRLVCLILACFLPAPLRGQENLIKDRSDLRGKADAIRASANDLFKLQRIPWVTDPAEGFRLAREENRPVFLYIQAGDPLEDC